MKRGMLAGFWVAALGLGLFMGANLQALSVSPEAPTSIEESGATSPDVTPAPSALDDSCGNQRCEPPEDCNSCPQDCGSCCGNRRCEPPEDCDSCPQDCC